MSNIEKAVLRLEQLRKAGVEAPSAGMVPDSLTPPDDGGPGTLPTPERLAEFLPSHTASPADVGDPVSAAPPAIPAQAGAAGDGAPVGARSKRVEIDLAAMAIAGYITPDATRAQIADEFRVIKRPIIQNAHWKSDTRIERGNRVMVTSALPEEGKTFVAINLALSIALEIDSTVLLVDADVANPCIAKVMNLPRDKGLMDLLTDDRLDVADVLLRTNVDKLSLLPAGTPHPRATEMLASQAMADLVAEMASRYPDRILVFDSPPLLVTTEARVLASHMGQIVMVVESDRTSQTAVMRAIETIESCPTVLMVLNKAPRSEVGTYYGYGYRSYAATS
jgi:receptor protein-tyrosine kinase